MSEFKCMTTRMTVIPDGDVLFHEMATHISITDEGGGEYVEVHQPHGSEPGEIKLTVEEWPAIKEAIDKMIKMCRF